MMPARSTTTSPIAASASGVAVRTVASRNAWRGDAHSPTRSADAHAARARTATQGENDHRLDDRHDHRRHAGVALHGRGAGFERAEQDSRADHRRGIEPREQRDGDRGVAVARRDVLVQRVRHAGHLDRAGEPGERAADQERVRRHALDVDQTGGSRGVRIGARRRAAEIPRPCSACIHHAARQATTAIANPRCRRVVAPKRGSCAAAAIGVGLRIDVRRFLQRAAHEIRHEIRRNEVQHDRADHFEHVKAQRAAPRRSTPTRAPASGAGDRAAPAAARPPGSASTAPSATAVAAAAPTRNWPSAPMLNTPARNAMATASPVRISGVARTSVPEPKAYHDPNDPRTSAPSARHVEPAPASSAPVRDQSRSRQRRQRLLDASAVATVLTASAFRLHARADGSRRCRRPGRSPAPESPLPSDDARRAAESVGSTPS